MQSLDTMVFFWIPVFPVWSSHTIIRYIILLTLSRQQTCRCGNFQATGVRHASPGPTLKRNACLLVGPTLKRNSTLRCKLCFKIFFI